MKISKKVREEAALICAIAASSPGHPLYCMIERELGLSAKAGDLALRAWSRAGRGVKHFEWHHVDAEAEALLRTGWSP